MTCAQLSVITALLVVGAALYIGNSVGIERAVVTAAHGTVMLGQAVGVVATPAFLIPGSPDSMVDEEVSAELKAFTWLQLSVMRPLFSQERSVDDARQAQGYVPLDQPEPTANIPWEATLHPGINASVIHIPSTIDNYVVEGDLLLPEGVSNLKEATSVLIGLHGGGHIVGARRQEFGNAGLFVHHLRHKKVAALNLRQRLAPEFTVDQRVTDLTSVVRHLVDHEGFEAGQIALYGSSAGATMVLMTTFALLSEGITPGPLVVNSPVEQSALFDSKRFPSLEANEEKGMLTKELLKAIHEGVGADDEEKLSFLHRDVSAFPPTRLVLGATDVFLDHGIALGKKLKDSGVAVEVDIPPGMWHCPFMGAGLVPESREAVERAATWLERHL